MDIPFEQLLNKAKDCQKNGVEWHHHYLPPDCQLNNTPKHLIILEAKGNKWQTTFNEKPLDKLEKLENLFFKRVAD